MSGRSLVIVTLRWPTPTTAIGRPRHAGSECCHHTTGRGLCVHGPTIRVQRKTLRWSPCTLGDQQTRSPPGRKLTLVADWPWCSLAPTFTGTSSMIRRRSERSKSRNSWWCCRVRGRGTSRARLRQGRDHFSVDHGSRRVAKTDAHLRAIMVGHLRAVKSPETLFEAARLLMGKGTSSLIMSAMRSTPTVERHRPSNGWCVPELSMVGGQPPIRKPSVGAFSALMCWCASRMEGGAHVIMEAIACGQSPVLASRVPGNVGMLGRDYAGSALSMARRLSWRRLLMRCRNDLSENRPETTLLRRLISKTPNALNVCRCLRHRLSKRPCAL